MHLLTRSWSYNSINRSSHWRFSVQKSVFRNFTKFTGKHLCQSLFFNEVAGLVNFVKFPRTPFYKTPLGDCFSIYLKNVSKKTVFYAEAAIQALP